MKIPSANQVTTKIEKRRVKGCVIGGAVGDALGAPVEGMTREQIQRQFGTVCGYVENPLRSNLRLGHWTDDTALTIATMESMLEKGDVLVEAIKERMQQSYQAEPRRGFGRTTRTSLRDEEPKKQMGSNGAAMRIAPIALYHCSDLDKLRSTVEAVSRITHQHPQAIEGALAIAFALASAVRGQLEPDRIIDQTIEFLGSTTDMSYKLGQVRNLLARRDLPAAEGFETIGTHAGALASVGSAFFAFLRTPVDFRQAVQEAVNAGGDTDTIGSLTGALSGAHNGFEAIPRKWVGNLEARSNLEQLSEDFFWLVW